MLTLCPPPTVCIVPPRHSIPIPNTYMEENIPKFNEIVTMCKMLRKYSQMTQSNLLLPPPPTFADPQEVHITFYKIT